MWLTAPKRATPVKTSATDWQKAVRFFFIICLNLQNRLKLPPRSNKCCYYNFTGYIEEERKHKINWITEKWIIERSEKKKVYSYFAVTPSHVYNSHIARWSVNVTYQTTSSTLLKIDKTHSGYTPVFSSRTLQSQGQTCMTAPGCVIMRALLFHSDIVLWG